VSTPVDNEKIEAAIKDVESRLNAIRMALGQNETEINTLVALEDQLKENIAELKRQGVTVLASEYRKAKEDLIKTATRLAFLRIDRETYQRALNGQTGVLDYLKQKLSDNTKRLLNNVIKGKFGKKDDGS
jgi:chromosome segregation ATPase